MTESNITHYLEKMLKRLHEQITSTLSGIKSHEQQISDWQDEIGLLKIHYTSLLNTALAYESFDQEDFESKLS